MAGTPAASAARAPSAVASTEPRAAAAPGAAPRASPRRACPPRRADALDVQLPDVVGGLDHGDRADLLGPCEQLRKTGHVGRLDLLGREPPGVHDPGGAVYGELTARDGGGRKAADVPGLAELLAWAEEISPIAAVEVVDDAPGARRPRASGLGVEAEGDPDVERLAAQLRGAAAARGSVLATPAGARALLAAGVPVVARQPGQPAAALLLRLVQAMQQTEEEEKST